MAVAVSSEQQADSFVRSTHKLLIDGEWVEAASGKTFPTTQPGDRGGRSPRSPTGEAEDIDRAVRAARRAFDDDSPWRRMNASDRGRLIWRIADLIEEHGDELAMLESLDNGKPFAIARAADVALAADLFRYMAGWPTKIEGTTVPISALPAPGEYLAYTLREPVGVVGQIIPWNFPLLMAAWKLGPALACGLHGRAQAGRADAAVGAAPRRAAAGGRAARRAWSTSSPASATPARALAAHDDVDKVAFTGSTEVGKLIVKAAAGNLKKVIAGARRQVAERRVRRRRHRGGDPGAANAIFFNHGQCCNAGSRLYVQKRSSTTSSRASPTPPSRSRSPRGPSPTRRWAR